MAHFAKIINNKVSEVVVVNNEILENKDFPESEQIGINFLKNIFGEQHNWKQTSYNNSFRKRYAGAQYFYDEERDEFVPPGYILENNEWVQPPGPDVSNFITS